MMVMMMFIYEFLNADNHCTEIIQYQQQYNNQYDVSKSFSTMYEHQKNFISKKKLCDIISLSSICHRDVKVSCLHSDIVNKAVNATLENICSNNQYHMK